MNDSIHESDPATDEAQHDGVLAHEEHDAVWLGMFHQLVLYQVQNGHCFVPNRDRRHPQLAAWLEKQVKLFHQGKLSKAKQRELESLGMEWDVEDDRHSQQRYWAARWEERFAELVAFQKKHGHLRVSLKSQTSVGLKHWLDNQRLRLRNSTMQPEQKARLDSIGFVWELPGRPTPFNEENRMAMWESSLERLLEFHEEHGHFHVSHSSEENQALAKWVQRQRKLYWDNKLLPERQQRLEEVGFAWRGERRGFLDGWEARLAELVAFKERHGHLRLTKKNQLSAGLKHWVDNQRIRFRSGVMPLEQKTKLESIGLKWENPDRLSPNQQEHLTALWEMMFARLLAFRNEHGHCQVPHVKGSDDTLGKWVQRQRYHHKNNTLLPERRQRLEEIGFDWKSDKLHFASGWEGRFAELMAFREKHGHLRLTRTNEPSRGMSHWLDNQRLRLRSGTMKPEQKAKLDEIGFEWERHGTYNPALDEHQVAYWNGMFARLVAFKEKQGHTRVTKRWQEDPALASWLQKQRSKFRKGSGVGGLLPERLARLDALGTEWREVTPAQTRSQHGSFVPQDPMAIWESRYAWLVEFHRLNGHANVPGKPDLRLRKWVLEQRKRHEEGSLEADQIKRLEELGFSWVTPKLRPAVPPVRRERGPSIWEQRFAELQAFVAEHGHFRIPKKNEKFKRLRGWVVAQRVYHRSGRLTPAHQEKLEALDFPWDPGQGSREGQPSVSWEDHLRELVAFKERHGHTRVQHHRGPDKKLGGWLVRQRLLQRQGRLALDRFQKMEEVGVEWNPAKGPGARVHSRSGSYPSSDQRMAELREFHAKHGHANVPTKYPPNQLLGNWVSNTRIGYRKGQLSADRIQELEALGFLWRGERKGSLGAAATWEESFAALLEFQKVHGHTNVRSRHPDYPVLASWVISQRVKHRRGTLKADRVQKLEAIGFQWGKAEYQPDMQKSWDQRFDELVAFRRRHGHPNVSRADKTHLKLDTWVKAQRVEYHHGRLSAERIQRLEGIGFQWDGREGWWERQFRRWEAATQRRRTRHLTAIGDDDDDLAKWEQTQRNLHRLGKLSADKARLLTRAGLVFEVPPPSKSRLQMPNQKLHP